MANPIAPLLQQITNDPLVIDASAEGLFRECVQHVVSHEHAAEFMSTAVNMTEDDDFWPASNDWRATYRPYNVKNGILQIPVMGVMLNRFPWQLGRWATGYTYIEKAMQRGLADANVRGIAFIHDSPGGEVAGCFELGDKIYEARNQKPMRAFAADHAYSASYLLYSSVGKRGSISRSGGVGSIGVVTAHVEYSEMLKDHGIKVTFIFAGKHKVDGNAYEKLPDSVKNRIQTRIDRIYGVFVKAVARNRSLEESDVRATEALTYDSEEAIKAGLADRIGALEDEMVLFSNEISIGEEQMANESDKGIPQETHDKAVADARAEGVAEGTKAGMTAERTRINAILASDEGKKRPKAAMSLAMKTGLSLEEATASLADMPEEKAETPSGEQKTKGQQSHFEQHREKNNAKVETEEQDEPDASAASGESKVNSIVADYARAAGVATKSKTA